MKPIALIAAFLLAAAAWPAAETETAVNRLIETVRAGLAQKEPDKQLAKTVGRLKMAERLEPVVLENLESEGAGPLVIEQLERLRDDSENLKPPADALPFPAPPRPSVAEMKTIVQAAREYALNYAHNLPDFLCTETAKRYEDVGRKGSWRVKDTLLLHLSYADKIEDYKLISINNHPTKLSYESVGGAMSEGEFGSMMFVVFHPDSHPRIFWDHWTRLRGRPAQVYSYAIDMGNASYKLTFGEGGDSVSTNAGAAGQIYIDAETNSVLRLTRHATGMPASFPIIVASAELDYDYGDVGGRRFFLPTHATIRMDTMFVRTRNEVEFNGYRKFEGESTISFGDPAAPVIKK